MVRRLRGRGREHRRHHEEDVADRRVGGDPFGREQERQLAVDPGCGVAVAHAAHDLDERLDDLRVGHRRVLAAAEGAAEDEGTNPGRVTQRQLLRDHAAHRDAVHVGAGDAEMIEEAGGVVGHLNDGVGAGRLVAQPGAAIVVVDGAEAVQKGDGAEPGVAGHSVAHDEEQRLTLARFIVMDLHPVDRRVRHRVSSRPRA